MFPLTMRPTEHPDPRRTTRRDRANPSIPGRSLRTPSHSMTFETTSSVSGLNSVTFETSFTPSVLQLPRA